MDNNLLGSLISTDLDRKVNPEYVCTPATSDISDNELADYVASWEDAIRQCRGKLSQKDYDQALQFSTPEKLLEDLKARERTKTSRTPWLSSLYIEMAPTVRMLEKTSAIFLMAMRPKRIETSMIYVLFYVIIELSLQDGQRWAKMQAMLERATTSLRLCRHTAQWADIDEELRNVLLKMFKSLILFWANSAKFMRTNPLSNQTRLGLLDSRIAYLELPQFSD
ncbi:hypothetical protein MMC19_007760, partial [Ptychographa xylographoides]|nr:hypothetical protein [Ptychographa xylographoides]